MTDYHQFTTKNMSVKARRKLDVGDIWLNRIKCKACGDVIQSNNRHDFKYCKCGKVFVDGGSWYSRQGGELDLIEDMSENFSKLEKE